MRAALLAAWISYSLAWASPLALAQANRAPNPGPPAAGNDEYRIGPPIRHKNLTILPVLSKTEQNADRYTTLDEGLRAHTVEVIELGANQDNPQAQPAQRLAPDQPNAPRRQRRPARQGANAPNADPFESRPAGNEVNRLMVINRSGKPLYLMPGEVVVGGDQDRTIGEETTIASTGKPVPIDVFCVEHGRWGGRGEAESVPMYVTLGATTPQAAKQLAERAKRGYFAATAGSLDKASRKAVQGGEGQQAVWDNVEKSNSKLKVNSTSGAFTQAYVAKPVRDELGPYLKSLSEAVAGQSRVVGAVVAINGKIEMVDVFESTPLFRKLWPKLLKSYALDAVSAAGAKPAAKETSVADASEFLAKVLQASVQSTRQTKAGLVVTRREAKGATSYSAARGMGGGMGGGSGAIHAAGFAP
jgi:hypothetical protein